MKKTGEQVRVCRRCRLNSVCSAQRSAPASIQLNLVLRLSLPILSRSSVSELAGGRERRTNDCKKHEIDRAILFLRLLPHTR